MSSKIKQCILKERLDTRTSLVEIDVWDSRKYCEGILPAIPEVKSNKMSHYCNCATETLFFTTSCGALFWLQFIIYNFFFFSFLAVVVYVNCYSSR